MRKAKDPQKPRDFEVFYSSFPNLGKKIKLLFVGCFPPRNKIYRVLSSNFGNFKEWFWVALPQECLALNTRLATQKPINQPLNHGVLGYNLVMFRVMLEGWMFCSFYSLSVHELTSNANSSRHKSLNYSEAFAPLLNFVCRNTRESVCICISLYTHRQMHIQPVTKSNSSHSLLPELESNYTGVYGYTCIDPCA